MSNKHEVERLVRTLHRTTAELGDGATEAEWMALHVQIEKALSLARDLEEEDVRRRWDEADKALSAELARLDLKELEATTLEDEGSLDDGNYVIMLRYDDVVSLRKTLEGLERRKPYAPEEHEYVLPDGRLVTLWRGHLHVWSSRHEYEGEEYLEPLHEIPPSAWVGVIEDVGYSETFKRSILLQAGVLAEDLQRELDLWATNLRGLHDDESIAKMRQLDTTVFHIDFWFRPPRGPRALGQTDEEFIQGLFFNDPDTNLPGTFTIIEEE